MTSELLDPQDHQRLQHAVHGLQLPLNFGLEDLYEPNNNNAAFIFPDGKRFGASSLMLGYHSPVIKENYIKEGILEIEADEFSYEAVKTFVEAMYCGHLKIMKESFRELNKMCHVFQVDWMSTKCLESFEAAIESMDSYKVGSSDGELNFLFDEAAYFNEHARSGALLNMLKKNAGEERVNHFIRATLKICPTDYSDITLQSMIGLTDDHSVFLGFIKERIVSNDSSLDKVTRHLLLNIDLVVCYEYDAEQIAEIFDLLLDNEQSLDFGMLSGLYRKVSKECLVKQNKESKPTPQSSSFSLRDRFHDVEKVNKEVKGNATEDILDSVAELSDNLYMMLEYLDFSRLKVTKAVLRKILHLKRCKNWGTVHHGFLTRLYNMSAESKRVLRASSVVAPENLYGGAPGSVTVRSEKETTVWALLTSSHQVSFDLLCQEEELEYPCAISDESRCGLLIEVTPVSSHIPGHFDIKLILENGKYHPGSGYLEDIHCHKIPTDKLHLVLEYKHNGEWYNKCISWRGLPECKADWSVAWGGERVTAGFTGPVRLVVYLECWWMKPGSTGKRRRLT